MGSNVGEHVQYGDGRRLQCGLAGAVRLRKQYFSQFCVISNFALPLDVPTFLPRDTPSYRVAYPATKKKIFGDITLLVVPKGDI